MKYFCPMCLSRFEWDVGSEKYTTRHSHEMIAFAVDPNSERLFDWVSNLQLPVGEQDEARLKVAEVMLSKTEAEFNTRLKERQHLRGELDKAADDDARHKIQDEMSKLVQRENELAEERKKKQDVVAQIKTSIDDSQRKGIMLLRTLIEKSGLGKNTSGLLVGVPVAYNDGYRIVVTEGDVIGALAYAYEVAMNDSGASNMLKDDLDRAKVILDTLAVIYASSEKVVVETPKIPKARIICANDPNNKVVWRKAGRYQKVCGVCRHPLYVHAGQHPEIVIGLLGSERVGKSTVIAATIYAGQRASGMWEGRNDNWYWDFPITGDDPQWDSVVKDLLEPYEKGRAVIKTVIGKASHEFCVSLEMNVPGQKEKLTVTFVDLPGEYLNANIDMLRTHCKGLFDNADVYWLCLDVVQLQSNNNIEFMNRYGYNISLEHPDGTAKTAAELEAECDVHIIHPDRFSGLQAIQGELNNFKGRAAIILTKSDDFNTPILFDPNQVMAKADEPIYDVSSAEGGLGLWETKFVKHSRKILETAYLNYSASASAWPESLQDVFPEHAFFSLSAYGFTPLPKDSLETKAPIRPYRTRWPMLWTLAILGYLNVKIVVRKTVHGRDVDEIRIVKAKLNGNKLEREAYESICGKHGWKMQRHTEPAKDKKGRWG